MPLGLALAGLLQLALAVATTPTVADVPRVAAAADLTYALTEVADAFRRDTGRDVKLSFGSSGSFTQQIENGAPFEIFLSADQQYIARLAAKGLTRDEGVLYAVGRIVLFMPHGSPLRDTGDLQTLKAALADGRLTKFAIANPAHAPYGRAAREALMRAGVWEAIQPRLVLGENAAQAMQFAASGSCQGGIVPLSLSVAPAVARLGTFARIPSGLHPGEPLRQRMVLMKHAGATAVAFFRYVQQPEARHTFIRYGFVLPGEIK